MYVISQNICDIDPPDFSGIKKAVNAGFFYGTDFMNGMNHQLSGLIFFQFGWLLLRELKFSISSSS
jgi:hypothetical protein